MRVFNPTDTPVVAHDDGRMVAGLAEGDATGAAGDRAVRLGLLVELPAAAKAAKASKTAA